MYQVVEAYSPFPASFPQHCATHFQAPVQQCQGVFLTGRMVLEPVGDHREMKQPKSIRAKIPELWNFVLCCGLGEHVANKAQVAQVLLLRLQAERSELRGGLQRAQIYSSDKIFIRSKS